MALSSMTGYAAASDGSGLVIEVRTVNHRYLDISVRLPRPWLAFEGEVKAVVGRHLSRGRVEVSVRSDSVGGEGAVELDREQAERYLAWAGTLKKDVADGSVDLMRLLALPGVLAPVEAPQGGEEDLKKVLALLSDVLTTVCAMRDNEGAALESEILGRMDTIRGQVAVLDARRPAAVAAVEKRLKSRVTALLDEAAMDEARIAQEVALLADRSDVSEEIARLGSHIDQFTATVAGDGPAGRTLDFLLVEMNREVNTVGSKCQDAEMSATVVAIKGEIEKVREQVQNVE